MASDEPAPRESRVTTDREQIEGWARRHDRVPVREGDRIRLVPGDDAAAERGERIDWDDFEERLEGADRVVVYHGEEHEGDPVEVMAREDAVGRIELEDAEERLMAGETVVGTITETAVVERTIVEEARVESEVVDSEIVDRTVVDAQLLTRECASCSAAEAEGRESLERYGDEYFLGESGPGDELAGGDPLEFDVEVEEGWSVTIEEVERFTVESRIADVEAGESDAVEDVDLETDVDVEQLHDHLVESNLFDVDYSEIESVDAEAHAIDSEVGEGDTIETDLTQYRTVDREVAMTHDVDATATGSTRTRAETAHEEVVEAGLAGRERGAVAGDVAAAGSEAGAGRTTPTEDDEGKTVVDATGDEIGTVTTVEDGIAYVDPDPSIAETVMAKLGWGEADAEDYAVDPEHVVRISDDEIEVSGA